MKNKREVNTGDVFGKLTITSLSNIKRKDRRIVYNFKCGCGNKGEVKRSDLTKDNPRTMCLNCVRRIPKKPRDKVAYKSEYNIYKSNARNRDISMDLTLEEFTSLILTACYYCGKPAQKRGKYLVKMNGIDRLNSLLGYSTVNCKPCCKICNMMKKDLTIEEFTTNISNIHNHLKLGDTK